MRRGLSTGVPVFLAALLLLVGTAFAASNSLAPSRAGDGDGLVSGYTVTDVRWTFTPANPTTMILVRFTLDRPARQVLVRFGATTTWRPCFLLTSTSAFCVLVPGIPVAVIDDLEVASAA